MEQSAVFQIAAFVLGLLFGSFLNVCISRLPRGESILRPRSHCRLCGVPVRWYDNIPVLSWLLLRGRCRACHQPIGLRYPLVEIGVGLWFMVQGAAIHQMIFSSHASRLDTISGVVAQLGIALLGFLLLGLMVMDWQTQLLPDLFTLGGITVAFLLASVRAALLGPTEDQVLLGSHHIRLSSPGAVTDNGNIFLTGPEHILGDWLLAVFGTALLLLLVRWLYRQLRHREGMGLGDVKLLALIAAFLGFWPAILALFFGVLAAASYALVLLARGKAGGATRLAFGSFLAFGGLLAALYGELLINAYKTLL